MPILGNNFGMKVHLTVDQQDPVVYFWDELLKRLYQMEVQLSKIAEDTPKVLYLLEVNNPESP